MLPVKQKSNHICFYALKSRKKPQTDKQAHTWQDKYYKYYCFNMNLIGLFLHLHFIIFTKVIITNRQERPNRFLDLKQQPVITAFRNILSQKSVSLYPWIYLVLVEMCEDRKTKVLALITVFIYSFMCHLLQSWYLCLPALTCKCFYRWPIMFCWTVVPSLRFRVPSWYATALPLLY